MTNETYNASVFVHVLQRHTDNDFEDVYITHDYDKIQRKLLYYNAIEKTDFRIIKRRVPIPFIETEITFDDMQAIDVMHNPHSIHLHNGYVIIIYRDESPTDPKSEFDNYSEEEYQYYVDGEVFGFVVQNSEGEMDSVWGFYGMDFEKNGMLNYIRDAIK